VRAAAFLVITNVPATEWCASILQKPQVIGRGDTAQIQVPKHNRFVSRAHLQIWSNDRGLWIRDVGSRTGTRLNGVVIASGRSFQITPGDRITLGNLELVVHQSDPRLPAELSEKSSTDSVDATAHLPKPSADEAPEKSPDEALKELTPAEMEVVLWMSRGITKPDEIGKKLFRSPNTVRTQLNSIYVKLAVHSRDELVGWLRRMEIEL